MTSKRSRRSGGSRKARSLPAKALKSDQARRIKGGANIEVNYRQTAQKVRE